MTRPTVLVEIDFEGPSTEGYLHLNDPVRGKLDTNTLAPSGAGSSGSVFTDVTEFATSFSTRRGTSRVTDPILRWEAGTATVMLNNEDRRFDPTNLSGPYVSGGATQVVPMRLVRVRATWNGTTYSLWRGFIDNWGIGYNTAVTRSEVAVTASDGFKVLNDAVRAGGSAVGTGEDSGARITRILNSTDWETGDRSIATGNTTLQATTLDGSALEELLLTTDTELGELYVDGNGVLTFRDRRAVLEDTRSNTSQATFGDGGGTELPYHDLVVTYDDEKMVNEARIGRVGGTAQTATDATSKTFYLTHAYERTDLLMETDAVAQDYAYWIVRQNKDPELRFASMTIRPDRDPDNLYPQALNREIGDRITVKLTPPGGGDRISREVLIRGITHDYDAESLIWTTTWTFQSATKYEFLVLDHATLGKLDSNALAF